MRRWGRRSLIGCNSSVDLPASWVLAHAHSRFFYTFVTQIMVSNSLRSGARVSSLFANFALMAGVRLRRGWKRMGKNAGRPWVELKPSKGLPSCNDGTLVGTFFVLFVCMMPQLLLWSLICLTFRAIGLHLHMKVFSRFAMTDVD